MSWQRSTVAPDGSHHIVDGASFYDLRFDGVLPFRDPGLAPVHRDGLAWHVRVDGSPAYTRRFIRTFGFYEGHAAVQSVEGWHHVRPDGTDLYAERYAWCGNFQGSLCAVRERGGHYLHVQADGSPAYSSRWRYAGDFRDGHVVVQADDGRSTHVDRDGTLSHGRWFLDLDVFHKGFARARDAIGWMHVDKSGAPAYARRFSQVEPFYNGQARVEQGDGRRIVIDERGETVVELRPASFDLVPLPTDRPVAILVRHAERPPLPRDLSGHDVSITDQGQRAARRFGDALGARVASITTSPVRRCRETAIAIAAGVAVNNLEPRLDRLLGDPGAFVVDGERAWENWLRLGNAAVIEHVVTSDEPLPGMAAPREAARRLLRLLHERLGEGTGIHIFVTHDIVLAPFVSRALALSHVLWPDFLAAAVLWRDDTDTRLWFDGRERTVALGVVSATQPDQG
jgi:broad specificity phosphatase PhoE